MPASLPEWTAVALALAYVLLAIRQNRWCWPAAAASAAIYMVLFARGGLPMQAALQVFYVGMAAYGWWSWRASHGAPRELQVTTRSWRWHAAVLGAVVAAAAVNGRVVQGSEGPVVSYADAWVAWGSVVATWMVARKILENWLYWILFDLAAAALYLAQGFHATTGLFIVYVVLAVRGYFEWRASMSATFPTAETVATSGRSAKEP